MSVLVQAGKLGRLAPELWSELDLKAIRGMHSLWIFITLVI
jgi:hypothetical protein